MWQQYKHSGATESRQYYVYTPANYEVGKAVPLIVMLHGCTQSPADFATGTQMNRLADEHQSIVAYPQQARKNHHFQCWNWYHLANQYRGSGEPAIIAGIVQDIVKNTAQWTIDTSRIYVAGASAGAAMAVILGATYPDIFAAIGVHSGVQYQAATNPKRALRAMRRGGPDAVQQGKAAYEAMGRFARVVPTIVFHGSRDHVVPAINGDLVVQQWMHTNFIASHEGYNADFRHPSRVTPGQVPGGRAYTVYAWNDSDGNEIQQYWKVDRMGHAWSGGHASGSYTDPKGPSASQAMYRFFMNHPMPVEEEESKGMSLWENLRRVLSDLFKEKMRSKDRLLQSGR
jgi:poly(hydroxyalkanoate) depolymerase family esterase